MSPRSSADVRRPRRGRRRRRVCSARSRVARVAHRDRGVTGQQELGQRLADEARASAPRTASAPFSFGAVVVEDLRGSRPACTAQSSARRPAAGRGSWDAGRRRPSRVRWRSMASSSSSPVGQAAAGAGCRGSSGPRSAERSRSTSSPWLRPGGMDEVLRGDADAVGRALLVARRRPSTARSRRSAPRPAWARRPCARASASDPGAHAGQHACRRPACPSRITRGRSGDGSRSPRPVSGSTAMTTAAQGGRALRRLEAGRHLGEEALDDDGPCPRR